MEHTTMILKVVWFSIVIILAEILKWYAALRITGLMKYILSIFK